MTNQLTTTQPAEQIAPPITARKVWEAYVKEFWEPTVERPLGRRGTMITTENPNAHLARGLRYQSYVNGHYVIACKDEHLRAWANVQLKNSLGLNLSIFAKRFGIERAVTVEFVVQLSTEKF